MTNDTRFGLPLSLPEALRIDPSPVAAKLADLIERTDTISPAIKRRSASARPWQAALTGLALSVSIGAQSYAATVPSLEGRWTMSPAQSSFKEALTGPAPDAATLVVTRDDPERLAYELIESRRGAEVARGAYDVSFAGAASTSSVDGASLPVTAERDDSGGVVIRAPEVGGSRAFIHVRRTGPDTALLEHEVANAQGVLRIETIALVRADDREAEQ